MTTPEVELVQPVYRRADLSSERFHYHWRSVHGPVAARIELLKRYVQNHRIGPEVPGVPTLDCDGVVEVTFASMADAVALPSDETYLSGAGRDEPNFLDVQRSIGFLTSPRVVWETTTPVAAAKAALLVRAAPTLSDSAFRHRWPEFLEGLRSTLDLCGLSYAFVLGEAPERPYDAVGFLTWPSLFAFEQQWFSDARRAHWTTFDELVDLSRSHGVLTQPERVI
jgi:hypothetical protein